MKLKSYFAGSVEGAISEATKELGPEAMLVYSREAPPEGRYLGAYEVVFALPPTAPEPARDGERKDIQGSSEELARLAGQVAEMRQQLGRVATTLVRARYLAGTGIWRSPALADVLEALLDSGLSPDLVHEVAGRLERSGDVDLARAEAPALRAIVRQLLSEMFEVNPAIGVENGGSRVVAVVGPPGAGKTTTLVKLAATYGPRCRRPVQILSVDTWRVAGAEQLRTYAAILGAGFQALETTGGLMQALEEHRLKNLILIDTPGYSERDMDEADELAVFLRSRSDIDVHLTLSASVKSADLSHAVGRFERFRPTKLILTRLDETASVGTVLNEAVRAAKPISFLTSGQRIPEDLHEASRQLILDLALGSPSDTPEESPRECGSDSVAPSWGRLVGSRAATA